MSKKLLPFYLIIYSNIIIHIRVCKTILVCIALCLVHTSITVIICTTSPAMTLCMCVRGYVCGCVRACVYLCCLVSVCICICVCVS